MPQQLSQILALVKGAKATQHQTVQGVARMLGEVSLWNGLIKSYRPKEEGGDTLPPEHKLVQVRATEVLEEVERVTTRLFDLVLTQEATDQRAGGDIVVEGRVLAYNVPVTYLLFLEKQLTDLASLVNRLPILDSAELWDWDATSRAWRSRPIETTSTTKVPEVIVKYEATDRHPAQTELIQVDRVRGLWTTTKLSGALPAETAVFLRQRLTRLVDAVRVAREAANRQEAGAEHIGQSLFEYLLRGSLPGDNRATPDQEMPF